MKKIVKKIAAVGAAVMMMASISAMGVSAYSSSLSGHTINYDNTITSTASSAYTYFSTDTNTSMASVTGTYYYINTTTMKSYSTGNGTGSSTGGKISFNAPTNCRSVKIESYHKVVYKTQNWDDSLQKVY